MKSREGSVHPPAEMANLLTQSMLASLVSTMVPAVSYMNNNCYFGFVCKAALLAGDVAEGVECLLSKGEVLCSNLSIVKENRSGIAKRAPSNKGKLYSH
jgi:hypothetical protein